MVPIAWDLITAKVLAAPVALVPGSALVYAVIRYQKETIARNWAIAWALALLMALSELSVSESLWPQARNWETAYPIFESSQARLPP